jgi:hypothetical protein
MRPRFQADADLNEDIVIAVLRREPTVDFQTADKAGLRGLPDPEVLLLAARERRVLVTHARRTMPAHFARFINDRTSPGVLVVSQNSGIAAVADELLLIWAASDSQEWINLIVNIPL